MVIYISASQFHIYIDNHKTIFFYLVLLPNFKILFTKKSRLERENSVVGNVKQSKDSLENIFIFFWKQILLILAWKISYNCSKKNCTRSKFFLYWLKKLNSMACKNTNLLKWKKRKFLYLSTKTNFGQKKIWIA